MKINFYLYLISLISFALLTASCANSPTPELPAPVQAARQTLAQQLGVGLNEVEVASFEQRDWPDSCMGSPSEGEICAQVITPGYSGILVQGKERYEFRVDESGLNLRLKWIQTKD